MKRWMPLIFIVLSPLPLFAQPSWTSQVVSYSADGPITVVAADMDGDGDFDIVTNGWFNDRIYWIEQHPGGWNAHVVAMDLGGPRSAFPADMDFDGDMDVLGSEYSSGEVAWWAQTDTGWVEQVVGSGFSGANNASAVDLDLDGDMDVIGVSYNDNQLAWWENQDFSWVEHLIASDFEGAYDICAGDLDEDGDLDIAGCSEIGGELAWWERNGSIWTKHTLFTHLLSARDVCCVDLDLDGDLDITVAAVVSDEIMWWENRDAAFYPHVVTCNYNGARQTKVADLDLDGDSDIIASSLWESELSWYENTGTCWTKHVIADNLDLAKGVDAADFDDDGDLDVIAVSYLNDEVVIYKQQSAVNPDPIEITLIPTPYPTIMHRGETIHVNLNIQFGFFFFGYYSITVEAMLPTGIIYGPVYTGEHFIFPNQTIHVGDSHQIVPPNVPYGEYQWMLSVGETTSHSIQQASFDFTVTPSAGESPGGGPAEWTFPGSCFSTSDPTAVAEAEPFTPSETRLGKAYPNPFNETVTIPFTLHDTQNVRITVLNMLGREVARLYKGSAAAGAHEFSFNARGLGSGVYFVRVELEGSPALTEKLMLLR